MRTVGIVLACLLGGAVGLVACSNGGPQQTMDAPTATTALQMITASFAEAEELLGFEIILPSYVPAGLRLPERAALEADDGIAYAALMLYPALDPERPASGIDYITLDVENRPPAANFEVGEVIEVKGVTVYLKDLTGDRHDQIHADWKYRGALYHLDVAASEIGGVDSATLRRETLWIIQSIIDQ